jgi:hypothetical protein
LASDKRDPEVHELWRSEEAIVYCADFSQEPAVAGGATLDSGPSITVLDQPAGGTLTFGAAAVNNDGAFYEYDGSGNVAKTVAVGKGVKAAVTPGSKKGDYVCVFKVTLSNASKPEVPVIFRVR